MKTVSRVDGFVYTTAIKKLRKTTKRTKVIQGGSSAGKTFGIIPILIDKACKSSGLEISIVSESIPHLRKGALKDFLKIMRATGRFIPERFNKTLLQYTFGNGSYIEFFSADQEGKVRGPRRNILYINECNNLKFDTYHQLAIRTSDEVWLDYNPSAEFWVHEELLNDEDSELLILTYKDNEALSDSITKEIEKARAKGFHYPDLPVEKLFKESNIKNKKWSNWWKVYGLGLTGVLEGVIYSNWQQVATIPEDAECLGYGLDFGFSNDPAAMVGVYRYNGTIYVDEIVYQTGTLNKDLIEIMKAKGVKRNATIYADSAEPKSIAEIQKAGFDCRPCYKAKDHKGHGIQLIQGLDMWNVTSDSVNMIKELRGYLWAQDKEGNKLNKPEDGNDHACDALLYIMNEVLNLRGVYKSHSFKVDKPHRANHKVSHKQLKKFL
jgi:phage terminase large subunit